MSTAAGHVETARNVASNLAMLSPLAVGFGFGKAKQAQDARAETEAKTDADKPRNGTPSPGGQQASSWWSTPSTRAVLGIGALVGAAAAGAAYYHRQEFANGWKYGYDHMTFVKNLWDADGLRERLEKVRELSTSHNVRFAKSYYTMIPPGGGFLKRTFAILPSSGEGTRQWWIPARNSIAKDEVAAHMGMFNPRENDGFYDLGLAVVGLIADRIEEEGVRRGMKPLDLELVNVVD